MLLNSQKIRLFTDTEVSRLQLKIAAAERLTNAEFKIVVCKSVWMGLKRKAKKLFAKHGLNNTQNRNGVLILLVKADQKLLIYGDEGIHSKVGGDFWLDISKAITSHFKQGQYEVGLAVGLQLLADALSEHYPATEDNKNELSNEIIFE